MRNTLIEKPSFEDDLLTVNEIAARLHLKTSWVYSHADELGAFRLGKYLRFSWKRVLEHLDRTALLDQFSEKDISFSQSSEVTQKG
jgi:hypothetical protein